MISDLTLLKIEFCQNTKAQVSCSLFLSLSLSLFSHISKHVFVHCADSHWHNAFPSPSGSQTSPTGAIIYQGLLSYHVDKCFNLWSQCPWRRRQKTLQDVAGFSVSLPVGHYCPNPYANINRNPTPTLKPRLNSWGNWSCEDKTKYHHPPNNVLPLQVNCKTWSSPYRMSKNTHICTHLSP